MSSQTADDPSDRSPEELAAVIADLAAEVGDPVTRSHRQEPQVGDDPLTRLDRHVAEVEARNPPAPAPPDTRAAAPLSTPLERVGHVSDAWSTLRATRPTAPQAPRAKLVSGVRAAAKKLGGHRRAL